VIVLWYFIGVLCSELFFNIFVLKIKKYYQIKRNDRSKNRKLGSLELGNDRKYMILE
jgi:hypothetical protein